MAPLANHAAGDKRAYSLAFEYLQEIDTRVTLEIIEKHLSTPPRPNDIQSIFRRLIMSAKNGGMKPKVIGKDKDIDDLKEILCDYNPSTIIQHYPGNFRELLDCLVEERAKMGRPIKPKIIWTRYCRTIMEGASFLNRFNTPQEFHEFVSIFHDNPVTLPALPLLLAKEIYGYGFPLACDFLKEIGYQNYSKPDTYLKEILPKLALSDNRDDLVVFRAVTRIAASAATTAFAVDKLFWLIGSGKFYLNKFKIGRHTDDFIDWAKPKLK